MVAASLANYRWPDGWDGVVHVLEVVNLHGLCTWSMGGSGLQPRAGSVARTREWICSEHNTRSLRIHEQLHYHTAGFMSILEPVGVCQIEFALVFV